MNNNNKAVTVLVTVIAAGALLIFGVFFIRRMDSGRFFGFGSNSSGSTGEGRVTPDGNNRSGNAISEYFEYDEILSINVNVDIFDVTLMPSDKYAVEYIIDDEKFIPDINMTNGVLDVLSPDTTNFSFDNLNNANNKLIIYYPAAANFDGVYIKSSMGKIVASDFVTANLEVIADMGQISLSDLSGDSTRVSASMGEIDLKNIISENMEIDADMGSINIDNLSSTYVYIKASMGKVDINDTKTDTLEVYASMGDIDITKSKITSTFTVESDSGSFTLSDVEAKNALITVSLGKIKGSGLIIDGLNLNNSAGSVDLEGYLSGVIDINCSLGSVSLTLDKPREEYNIVAESDLGSIKIGGNKGSGSINEDNRAENFLNVYCDAGSVDISFS